MIQEIKEQLINNPENIVTLLEEFNFEHISLRSNEIRFARSCDGGPNIRIRLTDNEFVNVSDYARGVHTDIFRYIIEEKNVTFRDVILAAKRILGLDDYWRPARKRSLFGGIYQNIGKSNIDTKLKTYDEDVLKKYECCCNKRFLRDGISLDAQRFFNTRFSIEDNAIIIPIYDEHGDLVGAKARVNDDITEGENKYYYPIAVASSKVLYGYVENYSYLYGADTIYIGESEKFCMQLYTMGVRNCVSIGSHTLSEKQAKLLLQLAPKSITFMFDEGLDLMETKRNADVILSISSMFKPDIKFFDYRDCDLVGEKDSPSDRGRSAWDKIIENHIKDIKELETK